MGIDLYDLETDEPVFSINFWHWRAIVEVVRRLDVLPTDVVNRMHDPYVGQVSREHAQLAAIAIRDRVLPTLAADERVMLDGTRTTVPDDGVLHETPETQHLNYSTNRDVLERFVTSALSCNGFRVT